MELDLEALEKLSALAKAQEDANKLKASELNILRRREQIALNEREETVKLRQEVRDYTNAVKDLAEELGASITLQQLELKMFKSLQEEMQEMRNNMLLLLTEHNMILVKEAIDDLSKKRQKSKHIKNLDKLKEQAAEFGIEIPLKLLNAIEKEEDSIESLS